MIGLESSTSCLAALTATADVDVGRLQDMRGNRPCELPARPDASPDGRPLGRCIVSRAWPSIDVKLAADRIRVLLRGFRRTRKRRVGGSGFGTRVRNSLPYRAVDLGPDSDPDSDERGRFVSSSVTRDRANSQRRHGQVRCIRLDAASLEPLALPPFRITLPRSGCRLGSSVPHGIEFSKGPLSLLAEASSTGTQTSCESSWSAGRRAGSPVGQS